MDKIENWLVDDDAGMRIDNCYRCNKLDMIDKRGLCLNCVCELIPDLKLQLKNLHQEED